MSRSWRDRIEQLVNGGQDGSTARCSPSPCSATTPISPASWPGSNFSDDAVVAACGEYGVDVRNSPFRGPLTAGRAIVAG
jgi:hypothetical protein